MKPAFLFVAAILAQTSVATAALPAGTPVSPYITGQNYWYYPPDAAYPIIKESGVTMIRIGGHAYDVTPLPDADILKQVDNIRAIGAEPLIQVSRYAGATVAADTVRFINVTNGRAVKYWSIGNEPDIGWTGNETDLAAYTADYIKTIAPAMRDVDPTINISGPEMAYYSGTKYGALLGGASDITGKDASGRYFIDSVTFHRYPFSSSYARSNVLTEVHTNFENTVKALLANIDAANVLQGRTGAEALTWGLTEFNIDYSNPVAINNPAGLGVSSFLNGQFFAEYYRVGMKHGVRNMNTWSVLEGGGNGSAGDLGYLGGSWSSTVIKRSSFYHMQMVAKYLAAGGYVPSVSTAPNLSVVSTSSPSQDTVSVMLLNEDDAGNQSFTVRLNDEPVLGPGTKVNVSADLAQEYSGTLDSQSTVVLVFDAAGALKQRISYSLARYQANLPPLVETFSTPASVPSAPTGLAAKSGDKQIALSWTAANDATAYNVKRSTVTGGPYATLATGVITTSYTDFGLTNGTPYFYVVSGTNSLGEGPDSAEVSTTPQAPPTPTPTPTPTPLPPGAFEAESLPVTVNGSTTSVNSDTAASGGKWVQLNASAAGPYMEFTTGSVDAGTYNFKLTYKANNNRGQCSITIDGTVVGDPLDQYASAVVFRTQTIGSVTFATAGPHVVRFTAVGKNAASSGFLISADKLAFVAPTPATVTLGNLDQTYDGTPKSVTVTTTPANLSVKETYGGSTTAPTDAGTYDVVATITDPEYTGSASGKLTIARATATIQFAGLDQPYDGTPKSVTATTLPENLPVTITYDGSPDAPKTVGAHLVVGVVDTTNYTGSATATLTIRDTTPPVLSLPGDLKLEATSAAGAVARYAATARDGIDGPVPVSYSIPPGSTFPLGTTSVTVTATDAAGNRATGSFTVTVSDTTAPKIRWVEPSRWILFPPNHKMIPITLTAHTFDAVSSTLDVRIVSVTSNEDDDGRGPGHRSPDWVITGPMTVDLRAERDPHGWGRVYTLKVAATDAAGNTSYATTWCFVL